MKMRAVTPSPAPSSVRRAVKQMLFNVGYYHRRLAQLDFGGVAILCYHGVRAEADDVPPFSALHVTAGTFERHCRLIAEVCNPISLDDLRAARAGRRPLPARPVMVTFDDGYKGVLDHALPALEQHGIPAAVFTCASPVIDGLHFWFDALGRRDGEAAVLSARSLPYDAWRRLVDTAVTPADADEAHRPLTPRELERLARSPMIEIGGHTMTHPTLALAPIERQRDEIARCRRSLQEVTGRPVDAFAYPYGIVTEHYGRETVDEVRKAGFDLAFTTGEAFASVNGDPFQLPRFMMLDSVDTAELAHRLVHSWHNLAPVA
jgi:peptidoglycan/xylan/chitin deacetylase (PgdA/CDA1 family)